MAYPAKGRTINFIVGYPPGGATDASARLLALFLEETLGVRVRVANRAGDGTRLALAELAGSEPNGYSLGQAVFPTNLATYMDARREVAYSRRDFQPVATYHAQANTLSVRSDSPYMTLRDLVAAVEAGESIKVGTPTALSGANLGLLLFEKEAEVTFAKVHLGGGAAASAALLGGKIDAQSVSVVGVRSHADVGRIRVLGIMARERDESLPDVKTFDEQGYRVCLMKLNGVLVPAGTSMEIIGILNAAIRKVVQNQEFKTQVRKLGGIPYYTDPIGFADAWDQGESLVAQLIPFVR